MRNASIKVKAFGIEGVVVMPIGSALAIDQHGLNNRALTNCIKAGDGEGELLVRAYAQSDAKAARSASHSFAVQVAELSKQEWSEERAFQRFALSRLMMKGLATAK